MDITRKTLAIFWRENCRHPLLFVSSSLTWLIGMTLQKLGLAFIIAQAINKLIHLHLQAGTSYWSIFRPYLIIFVVVGIVAQLFIDVALILLSKLETTVAPELQTRIFSWILEQSLDFHANTFSGALVNKVNRFRAAYVTMTDTFILVILRMLASIVFAIIVIAFFSPVIAGGMAVWTICFLALNLQLTRKRIAFSKVAAAADTELTAHLADALGNISAVKAFGNEQPERLMQEEKAYDLGAKKFNAWVRSIKNDALFGLLMTLLQFGVLALSIQGIITHQITIGTLVLVQVYVTQIIVELWGVSGISRNVEQALSDAAEMTEILDHEPEVKDSKKPVRARITKGAIDFKNVTFTHNGAHQPLFQDFNLSIKPGEKIGLVGHSGSGKTTLTRLLLRFSDLASGNIEIDGQNIAKIAQSDLRRSIAYVPQEPVLFHRSLKDNIAYAKANATEAEIEAAAKRANAYDFISQLPDGFDTLVGERGVKLSGGQRQRIAIARAILKDAPILVLDEATSALDSESELLIQQALQELMKKRTTIVIAHRLSTIQKMDRIIVMENGAITEQGGHHSLLKKYGAYATLWKHQSGGFIEE